MAPYESLKVLTAATGTVGQRRTDKWKLRADCARSETDLVNSLSILSAKGYLPNIGVLFFEFVLICGCFFFR
jgi:hypothetical protein